MGDRARGFALPVLLGALLGTLLTLALLFATPLGSALVRQSLLADPKMLEEAVARLQQAETAPAVAEVRAQMETPFGSSWEGAARPEVTLVEFYDYSCGYCRASLPVIDRLLAEEPGLRVVYRELPVLGPQSMAAARLALAASKVGRFKAFHDTLWQSEGPTADSLQAAARAAGIPFEPPTDPAFDRELEQNGQIAGRLGATGTPLFVVGDRVLHGAVGYDVLKQAIADARDAD